MEINNSAGSCSAWEQRGNGGVNLFGFVYVFVLFVSLRVEHVACGCFVFISWSEGLDAVACIVNICLCKSDGKIH